MNSELRDFSTSVILLLFAVFGFITANEFSNPDVKYGSDFLPKLILILLAIFSIILGINSILKLKKKKSTAQFDKKVFIRVVLFMALLVVYINLFFTLGFIVSSITFLVIAQYLYGLRKWVQLISVSIIVPIVLYFIFTSLFNIPLP